MSIVHTAASRGHADHGWLKTAHSFSFASWHDPERLHFGALRVLNDDWVAPGKGFGRHPHDNMEIVSIPLSGSLRHNDSMGNETLIHQGDVQIMTAGTGVIHSEYNASEDEPVAFLQIWVFPNQRDLSPRYDQQYFDRSEADGQWQCLVQPVSTDGKGVKIHQNAWFHQGFWPQGYEATYRLKSAQNGAYVFVLEGAIDLKGRTLHRRDAVAISDAADFAFKTEADSRVLVIDVPMQW